MMTEQQKADFRRAIDDAKRRGVLLVRAKESAVPTQEERRQHEREKNRERQQRFRQRHKTA